MSTTHGTQASGDSAGSEPASLTDVVDTALENLGDRDDVSVREIVSAFSGRVYGPLILIPGLFVLVPITGAIPGVPIFFGVLVVLISIQLVFFRDQPWLPGTMLDREMPTDKARGTLERMRPWAKRIDRGVRPRWHWLMKRPMPQVAGLVLIALAATTVPLAVVPWGVAVPGLAMCLFGLALTARDGVLMAAGLLVSGASGWFVFWATG